MLATVLFLISTKQSLANNLTAKVVSVLDGDTIEVPHNNRAERIRLSGIDCPEKGQAFGNLEQSFADANLRAFIQMATGSGKTFAAVNIAHRLLKFGGAKRILFLVDRGKLGKQTEDEFANFTPPPTPGSFPRSTPSSGSRAIPLTPPQRSSSPLGDNLLLKGSRKGTLNEENHGRSSNHAFLGKIGDQSVGAISQGMLLLSCGGSGTVAESSQNTSMPSKGNQIFSSAVAAPSGTLLSIQGSGFSPTGAVSHPFGPTLT
jgi:Type III restriction enzyme, res subunit